MSPVARRCGGCGGPLPEAPDDRRTITCSFCGMVNEVSATAPQPDARLTRIDIGLIAADRTADSHAARGRSARPRARDAAVYPWR